VLPEGCDAVVDRTAWEEPRVFTEIRRAGDVDDGEMARVFNLGIGMVLVVPEAAATLAVEVLAGAGRPALVIGGVVPGEGRVHMAAAP
jgi:phosphoribosylformylglycinamidine cyclo-ligase